MLNSTVARGCDLTVPLLITTDGRTPSTAYLATDSLAAELWPGDDQPVLLTPTVEWLDAGNGEYHVYLSAAQSATLEVGTYLCRVTATRAGRVAKLATISITVENAAATPEAYPKPYATFNDMLLLCPWIETHQTLGRDQAGFLEQLVEARRLTDELIIAACPSGSSYSPHEWALINWDGGAYLGQSTYIKDLLAQDKLIVTRKLALANARQALYLVMNASIQPGGDKSYASLAAKFYAEACVDFTNMIVEIDTNGDGKGEIAIPLGVTNTRWA